MPNGNMVEITLLWLVAHWGYVFFVSDMVTFYINGLVLEQQANQNSFPVSNWYQLVINQSQNIANIYDTIDLHLGGIRTTEYRQGLYQASQPSNINCLGTRLCHTLHGF